MSSSASSTEIAKPASSARDRRLPHWILLGLAAAVVGLSMILSLGSEPGQVMLPLINCPLPPLCTLKRLTGLDCPGCGLTRSFIALGHGQWRDSFRFNPAGPIWFALIAAQVPWQVLQLARISRGNRTLDAAWWGQGLIYLGVAALIGQWMVRQLGWW